MTTIVVISAGLSVPSSTRILADALGTATARALSWSSLRAQRARKARRTTSSSCATSPT